MLNEVLKLLILIISLIASEDLTNFDSSTPNVLKLKNLKNRESYFKEVVSNSPEPFKVRSSNFVSLF